MDLTPWHILTGLFYAFGFVCALFALWRSRTQQGATAWVIGLIGFPFLAVPLFLIFGRNKFLGYADERKELDQKAQKEAVDAQKIYAAQIVPPGGLEALALIANQAMQPGFTGGNDVQLLIDAPATYDSLLRSLDAAEKYILFQFYIFREDDTGVRFAKALMRKRKQGVRVYFLYDAIGARISSKFLRRLEEAGIDVAQFQSTKGWLTRLQINFRNHRKLVIVDGKVVHVGGLNIGDDYLGRWKSIGPWRDTHVRVAGPAAVAAQLSFIKDWYWAKDELPDLDWSPPASRGGDVLMLHTGPADEAESALLAHLVLVNAARSRIWIANPYLVPPESLVNALALASLRGVEVKIIIPTVNDNRWVGYASEVFIEKLQSAGVQFFRYHPGFMHQKVLLIDDRFASVGSANLDSRSLFINFEIVAISNDQKFVSDVSQMLSRDLKSSTRFSVEDLAKRPLWRQVVAQAVALVSPML